MATPHDSLFHLTFRHPSHAGPWLRSVVTTAIATAIEWRTVTTAPERLHGHALRQSLGDLVFTAARPGDGGEVLILVEHRSHFDPELPRTLLRYVAHLDHGRRRGDPPTPVVPVVCYHGPVPLTAAAAPDRSDVLADLAPRVPFFVDDLSEIAEDELLARALTPLGTLTLLCLTFLPGLTPELTLSALDRWAALLRGVDRDPGPPFGPDAIDAIGWYVLHVTDTDAEDVHMNLQRNLQRPEEKIVSTAERLRQQGHAEGRIQTLQRQIERRFGTLTEPIADRLQRASSAQLDRWTDRILDAKSLAELFAED